MSNSSFIPNCNNLKIISRDFISKYDGYRWGQNGPQLITRVAKKLCKLNSTMSDPIDCSGLTILRKQKCYEMHYSQWAFFFSEKLSNDVLKRTKDSYFVHIWNRMIKNSTLRTTSSAAYIKIAEKHCPKTLKTAGEFL